MKRYEKFLKSDSFEKIGLERKSCDIMYFCTPKGAKIIGWANNSDVHYCFIRGFGETVFAVSPENESGDFVYPVANSFNDFLRLIISCGDISLIEQARFLTKAQFDSKVNDRTEASDEIRAKFSLAPIEEPYNYIMNLQYGFDYSKIKYTEDFYDEDMNPNAPKTEKPWKVTFNGSIYSNKGRGGTEIPVNSSFYWGNESWYIPAVYSCKQGIVIDFCANIDKQKAKEYINRLFESSKELTSSITRRIFEEENPLNIEFSFIAELNKKKISLKRQSGVSWIPDDIRPSDINNSKEAMRIIEHYGLDKNETWVINRSSCLWATKNKPKIVNLEITLERKSVLLEAGHFANPSINETVELINPYTKEEYKAQILGYEEKEFPANCFPDTKYEFPKYYTQILYSIKPEISEEEFYIRDIKDNEQPKALINENSLRYCPEMSGSASVSIIGGADGPTVFFVSSPEENNIHTAMSALSFEPKDDIEWVGLFRAKLIDDIKVKII